MTLSPAILLTVVLIYFSVLIAISFLTSKKGTDEDFYIGGRKSPWYLVAFGMIGTSLSGVTFISVPGWVSSSSLSYMQMVLGFIVGYAIISTVLMPLYYRLQLTSIYTYLNDRLGFASYKTGSSFFLISRIVGASFRLYLVSLVFHRFITSAYGISFAATVIGIILLIWVYTYRGGIRTIVFTDTLQTAAMLLAVITTVLVIKGQLQWDWGDIYQQVFQSEYSQIFFTEGGWSEPKNFWKQFFAGASISLVMTGLDQDMMQKNLSIKRLEDAQKNMFWFSMILVPVNLMFLAMGILLYYYAAQNGIDIPSEIVDGVEKTRTDLLYPELALKHFPIGIGILFIIGLIAAAYSSADSALTALTTSFCVDILGIHRSDKYVGSTTKVRRVIHVMMSLLLFALIMIFYAINNSAVIEAVYTVASYTYGPLFGLYAFSLFTRRAVYDKWVPVICVLSPVLTYIIKTNSAAWFNGYTFGFELLILNGLMTFLGLLAISRSSLKIAE